MFFVVTTDSGALNRLAALVDDSGPRVTVAATFPLADTGGPPTKMVRRRIVAAVRRC
jgi:hypothetical protein